MAEPLLTAAVTAGAAVAAATVTVTETVTVMVRDIPAGSINSGNAGDMPYAEASMLINLLNAWINHLGTAMAILAIGLTIAGGLFTLFLYDTIKKRVAEKTIEFLAEQTPRIDALVKQTVGELYSADTSMEKHANKSTRRAG